MRLRWPIALGLWSACAALAFGIVTPFVDVDMGVIAPGVPTPAHGPKSDGLILINNEDESLRVKIAAETPAASELVGPGEPLPDARWIAIVPAEVVLSPHERILCRIIVTVPTDAKVSGRSYQALIVTRAERMIKRGIQVRGALRSRLRFHVKGS